ncbi:YhdN [Pantoea ananatis LMG 20103]|uniref:YhdN n=1 Tax=Pantoea ananatis (strain LMG 20103) TaxID=706191 RepID=D4GCF1_PANAM|nr:YhdN [Pantoea ananatis LMG 20103]
MWLIDQLVEQHIKAAQEKGELSNLPGEGAPLQLEDDSQVPPELRAGFRLLKNAGFLPRNSNSGAKRCRSAICYTI